MGATSSVDYDAIAKQYGATSSSIDYDALAKQHGAISSDAGQAEPRRGAVERFARSFNETSGIPASVQDNPSEALQGLKMAVSHPSTLAASLGEMAKGAKDAQVSEGDKAIQSFNQPGILSKIDALGHAINSGIPLIGPAIGAASEKIVSGDVAGGLGSAAALTAPLVAAHPVMRANLAEAAKAPLNARPLQGVLAKRMAEVPAGESFSRGEVLQAARNKGVNLDVAQATDSGMAVAAKKANRYSLASQGTYDAAQTKNLAALDEWANSEASKYSPASADRSTVGGQMQEALRSDLEAKKQQAGAMFKDLDTRLGNMPVDQSSLRANAQKIVTEYEPYYARHPELLPKQAWAILNDIANEPRAGASQYSLSELHQLRSDLQDFYRNTPDLIKGKSQSWIQRAVSDIDKTMTNTEKAMKPLDVAEFRKANGIWESVKGTYDNNQHPFYHAVRSQFPSQVPQALATGRPELAAQVRATLGSLEGPFQRQFVENLIQSKDGALDLGRLNQKLKGVPQDHLEAMLGKDGAKQLRLLGKVSQKVMADANPSGTAKVGVPAAEVSGMFNAPIATTAELAAQYGGARLMNSPKVIDYLTKPKRVTAPLPRGSRP
jgi:hypothetical protein